MGKPIVYCGACGKSLREADFEKGRAHIADSQPYCVECHAMETPPPPPPGSKEPGLATSRIPHPDRSSSSTGVMVGVGVFAAVALLLIAFAASGGSGGGSPPSERPRGTESPSRSTSSPVTQPPEPSREERLARAAFDKARDFAKTHPQDLEGQSRQWDEAVQAAQNTAILDSARLEANRVRGSIQEALSRDFQALEDKIRDPLARQEFRKAIDELTSAQKRREDPEWRGRIGSRIREIQDRGLRLFEPLKDQAVEAERRGATAEAKSIADRVARWGLHDLDQELQAALAAARAAPPLKPLSKEAQAYRARWREAMMLASSRDYAAALKGLDAPAPPEPELREERSADVAILRGAAALVQTAVGLPGRLPKGQTLTLEFWNERGAAEKVSGPLLRSDPGRVVLGKVGEFRFVELGELTAASLVELWSTQPEKDRKPEEAAAIPYLLLLEGDLDKAEVRALPERFLAFAKGLDRGAGIRAGSDRDTEARRRFFDLERDFFATVKTSEAVEGYKSLLKTAADTPFVRRNRLSLEERAEGGKEYFFFAGDFEAAGFDLAKNDKVELCLTLGKDLEAAQAKGSFVDFSFSALPGADYRCWVQVGACCAETFQFTVQATELKGPNPRKASEILALDPGSEFSLPVKNSILGLKKTHAQHGGPKQPARWEWILLPLPKFASPGPKTLRLFSEHKGFSIAAAWISSVRPTLPKEAEIREFRRFRPAAHPKVVVAAARPAAGKVLFSENFEKGLGKFNGGEIVDGGVNGSKACLAPLKGFECWNIGSIPASKDVTLSFKVKPSADVGSLQLLVWSDKLQDNGHFIVQNLKKGEWREVRMTLMDIRVGWAKDPPPIDLFGNIKLIFTDAPPDTKVLIDDFEVRG